MTVFSFLLIQENEPKSFQGAEILAWFPSVLQVLTRHHNASRWDRFPMPTLDGRGRTHRQRDEKRNWGKTEETRWSPCEHAVLLALQMLKNKVSSSEKSVLSPKRVNFSLVPHVEDCMALHEGELTFFFFLETGFYSLWLQNMTNDNILFL